MKNIIFFLSILISFFLTTQILQAQIDTNTDIGNKSNLQAKPVTLDNPLGEDLSPNQLIGRIINAILGLVGSLALLMFVYGGLTWMTASGANEKVQKGKDIIMWATIGLIVIFMSYALVNFVLGTVIGGAAVG